MQHETFHTRTFHYLWCLGFTALTACAQGGVSTLLVPNGQGVPGASPTPVTGSGPGIAPITPTPPPADVPDGSPVTVIGRYSLPDPNDANHIRFGFSGTAMGVRFSGSSITAIMQDTWDTAPVGHHNFYDITLDGNVIGNFKLTQGNDTYPLASNLPEGKHELWITKRTEGALAGGTDFWRFELSAEGNFLKAPVAPARHILVMGASNETAWGSEAANVPPADCTGSFDDELVWQNNDVAWHAVAARAVGAQVHNISYAGGTVSAPNIAWQGPTFPNLFNLANSVDANTPWDPNAWVPDAVVLNFGPEDYEEGLLDASFEPTFISFVTRLSTLYPKTHIYLFISAIHPATERDALAGHDQNVIAAMAAQGFTNMSLLEMPAYTGDVWGCGYHTTTALHASEGALVAQTLQKDLGW